MGFKLPSGKPLATVEQPLSKPKSLERTLFDSGLNYQAAFNQFKLILPRKYPVMAGEPLERWPGNHFEMGLFGQMRYYILKENGSFVAKAELPEVRLAHYHYPHASILLDVGLYDHLRIEIELRRSYGAKIPPEASPRALFWQMKEELGNLMRLVLLPI